MAEDIIIIERSTPLGAIRQSHIGATMIAMDFKRCYLELVEKLGGEHPGDSAVVTIGIEYRKPVEEGE